MMPGSRESLDEVGWLFFGGKDIDFNVSDIVANCSGNTFAVRAKIPRASVTREVFSLGALPS